MSVDLRKHPITLLGDLIEKHNPEIDYEIDVNNVKLGKLTKCPDGDVEIEVDLVGGESDVDGDYVKFKYPRIKMSELFSRLDTDPTANTTAPIHYSGILELLSVASDKEAIVEYMLIHYGVNFGDVVSLQEKGYIDSRISTRGLPLPDGVDGHSQPVTYDDPAYGRFTMRSVVKVNRGVFTIQARSDDYVTIWVDGKKVFHAVGWNTIHKVDVDHGGGTVDILFLSANGASGPTFLSYSVTQDGVVLATSTDTKAKIQSFDTTPLEMKDISAAHSAFDLHVDNFVYEGDIDLLPTIPLLEPKAMVKYGIRGSVARGEAGQTADEGDLNAWEVRDGKIYHPGSARNNFLLSSVKSEEYDYTLAVSSKSNNGYPLSVIVASVEEAGKHYNLGFYLDTPEYVGGGDTGFEFDVYAENKILSEYHTSWDGPAYRWTDITKRFVRVRKFHDSIMIDDWPDEGMPGIRRTRTLPLNEYDFLKRFIGVSCRVGVNCYMQEECYWEFIE